ncbi:undecaprenyl-diphosphate phosphatase [Candidatus Cyanaurora vandensis]|uniref:undecaprenyl-diphosphate phosphatase n=1 Tax=Candidatus Cyanaurora vandensis TaxID=2714958 RepID=UPI00257C442E|nr:undecaprenyl-diphosphate phosphatase [Candidatus Cyanaurora vandensis]
MEWLQAVVLGLVQGLTEFLPISSTAHLQVLTKVLGWAEVGSKPFVATIQSGSVIAVVLYFWQDIVSILKGGWAGFREKDWRRTEYQLLVGIALGTIPILAVGFIIRKVLNDDSSDINSLPTIAVTSIVMALLLGLAEQLGTRKRNFEQLRVRDGLWMGLGQMIALIPGASRSGSTLTAGLFLGLERRAAARFSFLLGIPALTIATLYEFIQEAPGRVDLGLVLVGIISAFVFSYASIAWLLRFLQTQSNWVFVWYRLGFGTIILVNLALGWL